MPRAKTEQEIKEMRGRILDASLELLRQEGLEGLSIRKIADRLDVSHMLLYSYFENRAAIIKSLRERGFAEMEAFFAESLRRAETGDALVQVRASLARFIELSHEYSKPYRRRGHSRGAQVHRPGSSSDRGPAICRRVDW